MPGRHKAREREEEDADSDQSIHLLTKARECVSICKRSCQNIFVFFRILKEQLHGATAAVPKEIIRPKTGSPGTAPSINDMLRIRDYNYLFPNGPHESSTPSITHRSIKEIKFWNQSPTLYDQFRSHLLLLFFCQPMESYREESITLLPHHKSISTVPNLNRPSDST